MLKRSRMVALGAVVAALLVLPQPAVGQQDELERTRRRLGEVEAVLRDAPG